MNQLRKYSKYLIGYSFLVWLPGFYFLNTELLIGYILFPISAIMVTLGLIGWISKPRTQFDGTGYASWLDKFLGWLWERFAPKWFTFFLVFGIYSTTYLAYRLLNQNLEWRSIRSKLEQSGHFKGTFTSEPKITSHELVMRNEYFTKYELTIEEGENSFVYILTLESPTLEIDSFEEKDGI